MASVTNPIRGDETEFSVTLTLRLTTTVAFARGAGLADDAPTKADAIDNAIGRLPEGVFSGFGGEFAVALPVEGEAVELWTTTSPR